MFQGPLLDCLTSTVQSCLLHCLNARPLPNRILKFGPKSSEKFASIYMYIYIRLQKLFYTHLYIYIYLYISIYIDILYI